MSPNGKDKGRPPPDQYIIMAGAQTIGPAAPLAAADNLTISRNRRRTRLRSTALPTCLDTVKPTRTAPSSPRRRACRTKALCRRPRAAGGGTKIAPASQPLHGDDGTGAPITH